MGFSPEDQGHSGGSSSGSSRKGAEVELETPSWGARGRGRGRPGTDKLSSLSQGEAGGVSGRDRRAAGRWRAVKGRNSGPQKGMEPGRAMALLKSLPASLLLDHQSPTRLRAFCGHSALE